LNIFQPASVIKQLKERWENKDNIFDIILDEKEIKTKLDKAKKDIKDFSSKSYKYWKSIAEGTTEAKDTMDAYLATCVAGNRAVSEEGYQKYIGSTYIDYAQNNTNIQKIFDRYIELKGKIDDAQAVLKESKNNLGLFKPSLDDNAYEQAKKAVEDNEKAVESAQKAYREFDNSIRTVNTGIADFAQKQTLGAKSGKIYEHQARATAAAKTVEAAAMTAANIALSFGISLIVQAGISALAAWINSEKDAIKKANELADAFNTENDSINDNIDKIKELKDAIESGTLTDSEAYDKKKDLLEIQNDLYNTYGEEAAGIDLVNGKRDEEIAKLREIQKLKAQETLNNGGYAGEEAAEKYLTQTNKTGWNALLSEGAMSKFSLAGFTEALPGNSDVKKGLLQEAKRLGGQRDLITRTTTFDDVTYEEMIEIYDSLIQYINDNFEANDKEAAKWRNKLSERRRDLAESEDYKSSKEGYESSAKERIIANDDAYNYYLKIQQAIDDYNEAVVSGDTDEINKEIESLSKLKDGILDIEEAANHQNVADYFNEMFSVFDQDISEQKLRDAITTGISNNGKWGTISKALNGKTDVEAKAYLSNAENGLTDFLTVAQETFGTTIDGIISAFADLGIIESTTASDTDAVTKSFSVLVEQMDTTRDKVDKFDTAMSKMMTGETMDSSEVNEILSFAPDLLSSVEKTANGYVIAYDKMAEAREKFVSSERKDISDEIKTNKKEETEIKKEIAELQNNLYTTDDPEKMLAFWESKLSKYTSLNDEVGIKQATENIDKYEKIIEQNEQINAKIDDRKNKIKDINAETAQYQFLLEQLENSTQNWVSILDSAANKFETITSKILEMRNQMAAYNELDPTTALDFMQQVPDWQKYLSVNNGKIVLNDLDNATLSEMIKKTSGLDNAYKALKNTTDKLSSAQEVFESKLKALKEKLGGANSEGKNSAQILSDMQASGKYTTKQLEEAAMRMGKFENGINATGDAIEDSKEELTFLDEILKSIIESFKSSDAVNKFNKTVKNLKHQLATGEINQETYDQSFATAVTTLKNTAAANDSEAQDLIDSGEEEIYNAKLTQLQKNFDDAKLIIDNAREDLQISVLEYQKQFAALNEQYYAPGTKIGNTEDGKKQYEANLREIEKLAGDAFSDITSRIQSSIDFGKIIDPSIIDDIKEVFEGQELPNAVAQSIQKGIETGTWDATDLAAMAPYLSEALLGNSQQLTGALQDALEQQKSYVTSAFEHEKEQLDNQLEAGLISSDDYIDEYTKLWEKYYKNKKEFAKEDLQTQKDILEAYKSEIQKQIDGLDAMSELQTQPYQDEIDALNDVQDEYDKMMDKRIKALNKEKEKLEEQNKEREKANDIQDKYLAMQKASVKKYIVLTNHGWEAQADSEEYEQAKKEYEDAKQDSVTDAIEKQIDALEKEKEARDESIQTEIEEREKQIKQIETPINNLTRVLTALLAQQYNLDPDFIAQLLSSADGTTALEALNKKMAFSQSQASAAGVDVPDDTLTTSDAQKMVDGLAEENNRTAEEAAKNIGLDLNSSNSTAAETTKSSNATAPQSDEVTKLVAEWNAFYAELQKAPSNYGEKGHEGNVDINHRTSVVHDTEGNYGTIYGSTLTYSDLADLFEQYLVSQEKQGKIISEDIWAISESLWQKADQHPDGAFNVSPFKPDGKSVVDLNSETYEDDLYNYLISQLAKGIKLENMDIFMGGDYTTVDEADAAAQKAHEDSAELYKKGAEILTQLLLQGYDINQLQGAAYDGEVIKTSTQATEALTEEMKKSNDNAEKQNADSKSDNNKTKDITVGGYNLVADPKTGKLTKKPVTINGEPVEGLGHKVNATTKAEHDKHKSDYQKALESGTFTGSFADYMRQQRARKKGIVPIAEATGGEAKVVAQAIQAFTRSADIPINSNIKTNQIIEPADVVQVNTQPAFNCTINIEGSADEKTVEKFRSVCENEINGYFQYLNNTMNSAFVKSRYSK
jgi:hypothetical protein